MAKSLVRISQKARQIGTKEYQEALEEFISKMGGPNGVAASIISINGMDYWSLTSEKDLVLSMEKEKEDLKAM